MFSLHLLSYICTPQNNHIYTSGAAGTNAAVIRGALRAERPDLLTVILPQSLAKQPAEAQELLKKVSRGMGWVSSDPYAGLSADDP